MKNLIYIIVFLFILVITGFNKSNSIYAGKLSFRVSIIYTKGGQELTKDIRAYKKKLQTALNEFDWKFPDLDFEKIETSINFNIDKESSNTSFNGVFSISSGLTTTKRAILPYKKTVYHTEKDVYAIIDHEIDPNLGHDLETYPSEFNSFESIVKFYITLSLAQSLDKLSYTNTKKFKLKGEEYFRILYDYESSINNPSNNEIWKKRSEIIEDYKLKRKDSVRRLNTLLFNAKFFFNKGQKDRAALFIKPMEKLLKKISKDEQEFFFKTFYYDIGKIFALKKEEPTFETLINLDKDNRKFYNDLK